MLTKIIVALQQFNNEGFVTIKTDSEHEAKEIAEYVLQTLNGLKCDIYTIYDNELEEVFIRDCMMEN